MEDASRRKDTDPMPPRPDPERQKTQREEEEQGTSQPSPEPSQALPGPPDPEMETILVEEQGSSQPPSEQAKVECFPGSRGTPSEDKPATWISDEYGERRPQSAFTLAQQYRDTDPEAPEYFDDMAEFYLEAARRLPITQMPKLAGFLSLGGLVLGLNEPVTNIIVNAMYIMAKFGPSDVLPHGADPVRHAADRASYVRIARKSRDALVVFMTVYFRHLTQAQAKRYLRAAGHDLVLAIGLVGLHRKGLEVDRLISQPPVERLLTELFDGLSADCARTKTALRYASRVAMLLHDPDDLMRLVESRYYCQQLDPILKDLSEGEQLSVSWVNDILNMLQHPWSPPPPPPLPAPTPGTFRYANGNVTTIVNVGQDLFSTTTITRDHVEAFNNGERTMPVTTISRHPSDHDHANEGFGENGYWDTELLAADPDKIRFLSFLGANTAARQLTPDMNSLVMCLLDTIHGFYIEALTMLPSDHLPRLLHAVLAAGYCHGVMCNPVHNIIVNSICYNLQYPPPKDEILHIHHTRSMTRMASCSLNALILLVHSAPSVDFKDEDAVSFLNACNCCLLIDEDDSRKLVVAALATGHPQPFDLVEFMGLFPLRDRLTNLLSPRHALSNADFETISNLIATNKARMQRTSNLCQPVSMDPDCWEQAYVYKMLEELLFNYGCKDHSGPQYKLGIICGVASKICSSYHRGITCYHANFLASTGDDPASSHGSILFFAEFWNKADDDFEQSKMPPICWPMTYYGQPVRYPSLLVGRCFICESSAIRIAHPYNANYFMGHRVSTDSLCAVAEREAVHGGLKMDYLISPTTPAASGGLDGGLECECVT